MGHNFDDERFEEFFFPLKVLTVILDVMILFFQFRGFIEKNIISSRMLIMKVEKLLDDSLNGISFFNFEEFAVW